MIVRSWALALMLSVSAPIWAQTSQQHAAAARAAEKRFEWRKALREWQAAYKMEINAEYLIRIGDAYAHLGNKAQARKQYEAYLADPLALPASAERVKAKLASLGAPVGAPMALDLPAPADPKQHAAAAPPLPSLNLPAPTPLPLPELDVPAAKTAAPTKKTDLALALPDLPGIAPTDPAKKPPATATQSPSGKPAQTLAAAAPPGVVTPAVARPPPATEPRKAPVGAIATAAPLPSPSASSGGARRTAAWITAGVAVIALGGGVFAYTKGSSAHSDLTGSVHDSGTAKSLLDSEKQNKTLSVIGLAGGLAAAGVSAFLFAF